jgi:hypothetical protein
MCNKPFENYFKAYRQTLIHKPFKDHFKATYKLVNKALQIKAYHL